MRLPCVLMLLVSGCLPAAPSPAHVAPAPPPAPMPAPAPAPTVKVGAAWVITNAFPDVRSRETTLAVQVVEASGERRLIKVGAWWREQKAMIEELPPSLSASVLFYTTAGFGHDAEPLVDPSFQIVREAAGDVVVQGRSGEGPWRELARVHLPAATHVERLGAE